MEKIYIGFSTKKYAPFSATIRWAENTQYSHVYIRRKSNKIGEYVYQATGIGSNFMGIDIFLKHNIVIEEYEFDIAPEKLVEILKFFIKNAGRKYGFKHIWELTKYYAMNKIGLHYSPKIAINENDPWICSVLAAILLEDIVDNLDLPDNYILMTPRRLYPYIKTYGKRVI